MTKLYRSSTGKVIAEFDEMPSLLFVSNDGHGVFDDTFIDGEWQRKQRSITVHSEVGKATTYEQECYVLDIEEDEGQPVFDTDKFTYTD
ncbi:hypothetical protein [Salibacterium aidingense]|uniref:hypothetical protein n=1 Tax=Salibacterium aidingense TaxID=384933 RepID=UPI003BD0F521